MPLFSLRRRTTRPAATLTGVALTALLALTACSGEGGEGGDGDDGGGGAVAVDPVAVATTTQLGSILDQVTACAGTESMTLMGPGDDPHDFSASSQQVAAMTRAPLVVVNGLGLEGGLASVLANAEADGAHVVEIAPQVDPLPFGAAGAAGDDHDHDAHAEHDGHDEHDGDEGHEGHGHGSEDPHFWMDVGRMSAAAEVIGAELTEATGEDRYASCGEEVAAGLAATDEEVARIIAGIPEDRRTLVTDHDSLGYFAQAYGFEVAGVVIPGGSTDGEPSSEQLAALVAGITEQGADALVMGAGTENGLIRTLEEETGGRVPVVELYEGGVGPEGSGAETYQDAMVLNAQALADALS